MFGEGFVSWKSIIYSHCPEKSAVTQLNFGIAATQDV
jgi:hypothetical protein